MKKFKLFVPGRLCIFGEHSDWAASYGNGLGYAIVASIDRGIYADISYDEKIVFIQNGEEVSFSYDDLLPHIDSKSYYSYLASTIKYMIDNYKVGGIRICITKSTLPERKGLSSSAAICVLVVKAYNYLYNLNLPSSEEMEIAYISEHSLGSKCGKLDQVVALGQNMFFMKFSKDEVVYDNISLNDDLYFVFAELNGGKNTIKILDDLNSSYTDSDDISLNVRYYLEDVNKRLVNAAYKLIENGDTIAIGKLMNCAQKLFDKYVSPKCLSELSSPILHSVLNDENVKKLSLGGKGVGSQGDGTVQFIVADEVKQKKLIKYLEKDLNLKAYDLTLKARKLKKAIIPLAGNGSRMYPFTNAIPKAFIPIVHDNMFKPVFYVLLEELFDAGISSIALVIDRSQEKYYNDFFNNNPDYKMKKIFSIIKFIYQDEKLGLAHALYCCKDFVLDDDFLFVLGDQFYVSKTGVSCTKQLLDFYEKKRKSVISVCSVYEKDVSKYGIFSGDRKISNNFSITKIFEKPTIKYAKDNLSFNGKYYAAFGEYILHSSIFDMIEKNIISGNKKNGEYQLTDILCDIIKNDEIYAFIPKGKMYDIGNVDSYADAMNKLY